MKTNGIAARILTLCLILSAGSIFAGSARAGVRREDDTGSGKMEEAIDRGWHEYLDDAKLEEMRQRKRDMTQGLISKNAFREYYEREILPLVHLSMQDDGDPPNSPMGGLNEDQPTYLGYGVCWEFDQTSPHWAVVGLRPTSGSDWNLELHDLSIFDICTGEIGYSNYSGQQVDFVAVDYNHRAPAADYAKAEDNGGACYLEWENGSDWLSLGQNGLFTHHTNHVAHIWDLELTSGTEYKIELEIKDGDGDLGLSVLRPATNFPYTVSRYWASRESDDEGPGGDEEVHFTPDASGYWGVVVWSKNGLETDYYITVSECEDVSAPTLKAPEDDEFCMADNTPYFSWYSVTGAEYYQIQVDDDEFSSPQIDELVLETNYEPDSPLGNRTYNWRVRALNSCDDVGPWSEVRQFSIDNEPPDETTLLDPADGTLCMPDPTPAFLWGHVIDADQYQLQVDDNPSFSSPELDIWQPVESYTPYNPFSDGHYYWRVRSEDECGHRSGWSEVWQFSVDTDAPSPPELYDPLNGTQCLDDPTPTLRWDYPPQETVQFDVQVSWDVNFSEVIINIETMSEEYTVSPPLSDNLYFWRVRTIDECGNVGVWSDPWSFKIDTTAPYPPYLLTPEDGEGCISDDTPSFTWRSAVMYAVNYRIQIDDNANFSSPVIDHQGPDTTYTPSQALSDGEYYWRVKANDACENYSGWSSEYSFTIDTEGPPVPDLYIPADGETISDNTPSLDWDGVEDAVTYWIKLNDEPGFEETLIDDETTTSDYTVSSALPDGDYHWVVRALDACGNRQGWSADFSFTIDTEGPEPPELGSPEDGEACVGDHTPDFDWRSVDGAVSYRLQVDESDDFSSPVIDAQVVPSHFTPSDDLADGTYSWRVRCRDGNGNWGGWSLVWDFTIDTQGPAEADLYTPTDWSTIADRTPSFDWESVEGAAGYTIFLADTAAAGGPLTIEDETSSSDYTVSDPLPDGLYYWAVKPIDGCGNEGDWSQSFFFTLDTEGPEPPVLLSPENGADCVMNDTPVFEWEAVGEAVSYHLQVDDDADFSSPEIDEEVSGDFFTPADPLTDGTYFWRVRSEDASGNLGGWTSPFTFTLDTTPPDVSILYPVEGAALQAGKTAVIEWSADDQAPSAPSGGGATLLLAGKRQMDRGETTQRKGRNGMGEGGMVLSGGGSSSPMGSVEHVSIELSRDDGTSWEVLFEDLENDGNEEWQVTGPESDRCRIRITAADGCGNEGAAVSERFGIGALDAGDGESLTNLPRAYGLSQNFPNPFNPHTMIAYRVPETEGPVHVELTVYDTRGRLVKRLVSETKAPGTYEVFWNGSSDRGERMPSGMYLYMMKAGRYSCVKKMVMAK